MIILLTKDVRKENVVLRVEKKSFYHLDAIVTQNCPQLLNIIFIEEIMQEINCKLIQKMEIFISRIVNVIKDRKIKFFV